MMEKEVCAACRERLAWYLADRLAAAERTAIEEHLATCARCRQELAHWREIQGALLQEDQRIPPDLRAVQGWENLRTRLPAQPRRVGKQRGERTPGERVLLEYYAQDNTNHVAGIPRAEEPPKRSRLPVPRLAWLPAVAVTLVIILVSVLLFNRLSPGMRKSVASGAMALLPVSSTPPLTTHFLSSAERLSRIQINAIQMLSADDGWAVGTKWESSSLTESAIFHYDGGRWVPVSDAFPNVDLLSLSMISANEGWAVGDAADPATGSDTGVFLHYTGGHWVWIDAPKTANYVFKVQMLSAAEGWALGVPQPPITSAAPPLLLLHYSNGAWSLVANQWRLTDLSMISPTDGWAVGDNGVIAHYQNGQWTRWPAAAPGDLTSVQMLSATDGWAAGVAPHYDTQATHRTLFLLHYDGSAWMPMQLPPMAQNDNYLSNLTGFAFAAPNEGWAVGGSQSVIPPINNQPDCQTSPAGCQDTSETSILLHYTGGHWQLVDRQLDATLGSISMVSANEGWAVGTTADPTFNYNPTATVLLHYHDGAWSIYNQWS